MDRAQKEKLVEELGQIFESSGVVVVSKYEGMTVAEMQDQRASLREAGGAVRVAKAVKAFTKENKKLEVLGGAMGETALDAKGVDAVAEMPSREELIASIVGCIGAPASNIAGAIGAPASNIASILSTIEEKAEAA